MDAAASCVNSGGGRKVLSEEKSGVSTVTGVNVNDNQISGGDPDVGPCLSLKESPDPWRINAGVLEPGLTPRVFPPRGSAFRGACAQATFGYAVNGEYGKTLAREI